MLACELNYLKLADRMIKVITVYMYRMRPGRLHRLASKRSGKWGYLKSQKVSLELDTHNHTASLSRRMSKCLVGMASESKMGKMVDTQVSELGEGQAREKLKSRSGGRLVR